jgi:hypothetical protein
MDERVRFVARSLDGEKMAAPCREFAISRKTGYKIFERYKESGLEALTDRSRRPTTTPFTSPTADVSASIAKKLISARRLRDRRSESKKSKKVFGWSALWITIWGTSTWRKKLCSLSTTLLAQTCYLSSRYVLLPMVSGSDPTLYGAGDGNRTRVRRSASD